jgi:hypothetical protein
MAFNCDQYDLVTLQCLKWVETKDINQLFGITNAQAGEIVLAILSFLFVMWLLKKLQIYVK